MIEQVIFALWFFLPAGLANMAPVIAAQLPGLRGLNAPLDFGAHWGGQRLFGEHKTWRGLVAGVIVATLALLLQQYLVRQFGWFEHTVSTVRYLSMSPWLLGPAFAVGALGGDAVESFAKRRKRIPSGKAWLPYDLIDYVIGAMLFALPFVVFDWWVYAVVATIWTLVNFIVSYIGYRFGLKARPM